MRWYRFECTINKGSELTWSLIHTSVAHFTQSVSKVFAFVWVLASKYLIYDDTDAVNIAHCGIIRLPTQIYRQQAFDESTTHILIIVSILSSCNLHSGAKKYGVPVILFVFFCDNPKSHNLALKRLSMRIFRLFISPCNSGGLDEWRNRRPWAISRQI